MTDTRAATDAPRYVPNCKHAYMNDGFDCPFCLRDRLAASEKECEWRGLLFDATVRGWRIEMQFKSGHDNKVWFLWKQHRDQAFELPMDAQMRPACPPDDVVKRIKEAVNG